MARVLLACAAMFEHALCKVPIIHRALGERCAAAATDEGAHQPRRRPKSTPPARAAPRIDRGFAAMFGIELPTWLAGLVPQGKRQPELAVSADTLMSIVPGLKRSRALAIAPHMNQAMQQAGISTPEQRAAFIAHTAKETDHFHTYKEYGKRSYFEMYEPVFSDPATRTTADTKRARKAAELGNTHAGDGERFRGRGAIQLTGRDNYTKASQGIFGDDRLVRHPELLQDHELAWRTAAWFWKSKKLNQKLGKGDAKGFDKALRAINTGKKHRMERFALYQRALTALAPKSNGDGVTP